MPGQKTSRENSGPGADGRRHAVDSCLPLVIEPVDEGDRIRRCHVGPGCGYHRQARAARVDHVRPELADGQHVAPSWLSSAEAGPEQEHRAIDRRICSGRGLVAVQREGDLYSPPSELFRVPESLLFRRAVEVGAAYEEDPR